MGGKCFLISELKIGRFQGCDLWNGKSGVRCGSGFKGHGLKFPSYCAPGQRAVPGFYSKTTKRELFVRKLLLRLGVG